MRAAFGREVLIGREESANRGGPKPGVAEQVHRRPRSGGGWQDAKAAPRPCDDDSHLVASGDMVRPTGFEPVTSGLGNQGGDDVSDYVDNGLRSEGKAACGPAWGREEHELALVVTLWPRLGDDLRSAILNLIKVAVEDGQRNEDDPR